VHELIPDEGACGKHVRGPAIEPAIEEVSANRGHHVPGTKDLRAFPAEGEGGEPVLVTAVTVDDLDSLFPDVSPELRAVPEPFRGIEAAIQPQRQDSLEGALLRCIREEVQCPVLLASAIGEGNTDADIEKGTAETHHMGGLSRPGAGRSELKNVDRFSFHLSPGPYYPVARSEPKKETSDQNFGLYNKGLWYDSSKRLMNRI
jgi:hypothetical protein